MPDKDLEKKDQELHEVVTELRSTLDSVNADRADAKEKVTKLEAKLDEMEKLNQDMVKKQLEAEKLQKEALENYKNLEQQLYLVPNSLSKDVKSDHMKAFEKFCRLGKNALSDVELGYLRTDSNIDGGYLAPAEYVAEINKEITEISNLRPLARIRTTSSKAMKIPKRTGLATAYWVGQGGSSTESHSKYGKTYIAVERLTGETRASIEDLMESAFNMGQEINADMVEAFNKIEGAAFVNGLGAAANQPLGFMQTPSVAVVKSGLAADIQWDNFIDLSGALKDGYNPIFGLNRQTLTGARKLKDGVGNYIWQPGSVSAGIANSIEGYPYVTFVDMDDIGASKYPVVFADFRYYTIVDHTQMWALRDDYSLSREGKVVFIFHKFVGGEIEIEEAFVKLQCAVTP